MKILYLLMIYDKCKTRPPQLAEEAGFVLFCAAALVNRNVQS